MVYLFIVVLIDDAGRPDSERLTARLTISKDLVVPFDDVPSPSPSYSPDGLTTAPAFWYDPTYGQAAFRQLFVGLYPNQAKKQT